MSDMSIAKEIMNQLNILSKKQIWAMFGLKKGSLVGGENYLQFQVGKNSSGGNRIKIELNGNDLYNISVFKIVKFEVKIVKSENDVYAEDMVKVLEQMTGMYARLA